MCLWKKKSRDKSERGSEPPETTGIRPKASARALAQIVERASRTQYPAAETYVARLRREHTDDTPADIVAKLEHRYLATLTASGAAVGTAAVFPGIGTLAAASAAVGETVFFLEATALFVLANAVAYGIPADHSERRRALILAVLVGDDSKRALSELIGPARTNGGWLAEGMASMPMSSVTRFNARMLKSFVRRFAVRRGALLLGKLLPVGIGTVIGGAGNHFVAKKIVHNAHDAFGTPPEGWPSTEMYRKFHDDPSSTDPSLGANAAP